MQNTSLFLKDFLKNTGGDYLNFLEQLHNHTRLSQIQKDVAFLQTISVNTPTAGTS
jgi:hypothetical protein